MFRRTSATQFVWDVQQNFCSSYSAVVQIRFRGKLFYNLGQLQCVRSNCWYWRCKSAINICFFWHWIAINGTFSKWLIIPNQSFAWWGFDFDLCANEEINVRWEQNGPNQGKDLSRERKNEERQTTIARLFANKCTPKIKNENWAQYRILSLWPFSLWWSSWYCLYQIKLK